MTRGRRTLWAGGILAVPYTPFLAGASIPHDGLGALLVCAASLGAPGAAGILWPGGTGSARLFVRGLAAASVLNIAAACILKLGGIAPTASSFGLSLGLLTTALGAWGAWRGGVFPSPRANSSAWFFALATFALSFYSGTHVVPPLEDQDMEVQGTAYGLAHDLQPICATNRNTLYWFAHPLLHHAFAASTLIFAGELESVRPPYDLAKSLLEKDPPSGHRGLGGIVRAFREPGVDESRDLLWEPLVYRSFLAEPALFGTRAANFAMSAAGVVLLFTWAVHLGARKSDAALVTLVHMTLPEVFVRSGYGGYYALTSALFLAGSRLAGGASGGGRSGFVAGFLGALSNQKTAMVVAATMFHAALRRPFARFARASIPLPAGALAGVLAFWAYGLALFPSDFVVDHLLEHAAYRFDGTEATEHTGGITYPTRTALWVEFGEHMGWAWFGIAAIALAAAVSSVRTPLGVAVLTILVSAAAFTFIDWRQTKHLCNVVPLLSVMIARFVAGAPGPVRWGVRILLVVSFAWNILWIVRLSADFGALEMSTIW